MPNIRIGAVIISRRILVKRILAETLFEGVLKGGIELLLRTIVFLYIKPGLITSYIQLAIE